MSALRAWRALAVLAGLILLAGLLTGYLTLRASLPRLTGAVRLDGLSAPVRIERDARGVPTIEASSRRDLAFATGYVHAQDRFFQMDLSRRAAAGELSQLFGRIALEHDRAARLFRFRSVARAVLAGATPAQRTLVEAYAGGVNAGLADLAARPWEYWVLGSRPQAWKPEDTILVVHAMWWDLQLSSLRRAMVRQELDRQLGGARCAEGWKCALKFFYPAGTAWDAPDGTPVAQPEAPIPDAATLNVRDPRGLPGATGAPAPVASPAREPVSGSNSWALAGRLTVSGAALVANDMHLNQRVPAVWYHARLRLPATGDGPALDLNGVTLPGVPLVVAGSNGHIAWAFTNSYGDWVDVQAVPCSDVTDTGLQSAGARVPLTTVREHIEVRGAAGEDLPVRSGAEGLLLRVEPASGSCWFGHWLAQLPGATNLNVMDLEQATSTEAALQLAPTIGIPHQNAVIGDRAGHIGWSIFGRIPRDAGPHRASGQSAWTTPADHPRLLDPVVGRIWTANAQVSTDARELQLIGGPIAALGADYDLGARARQIRDDLAALRAPVTAADMLHVQLDDRALFLARWQALLAGLLDEEALRADPRRAPFQRLVAQWNARASTDSAGYRLVRTFHERTAQAVWEMLLSGARLTAADRPRPPQFEAPLWRLITARPQHLLARAYPDWRAFLLAQVDASIADLTQQCGELTRCTWGRYNTARIAHPLARALPGWLAARLGMPAVELAGDHDMPRVQELQFGASERFAVAPGHESEGYLLIPGGQSGHPLSPFYRAGFLEWARGEPLPFLPGPAKHVLRLTAAQARSAG